MKSTRVNLIALLLSGASALPSVAHAQVEAAPAVIAPGVADTAAEAAVDDQDAIIITANRREEDIQSVPTAVTAIGGEALREQNITTAQDLLGKVPSMTVTSNGTQRSAETVVIRGQGQTYLAPVGVVNYFAEVPLIQGQVLSNQGGPGSFFDLESLQVLRGPQGTLFGKNTTGGALLLGPKKPNNRFGGYIQGQIGNYEDREIEGAINVPIVDDKLAVRAAFKFVDREGYTKDVGPGPFGYVLTREGASDGFEGKRYDDRHYWTARLGVLWRPTDRIENYLLGYYTKSKDNGTGLIISDIAGGTNLANLAGNLFYRVPGDPLFASFDPTVAQAILARQKALGPRKTSLNADQFSKLSTWAIIDTFTFEINDALKFRNIFGYQRMKQTYDWDLDGSILPMQAQNPFAIPAGTPPSFGDVGDKASISNLKQITEEAQIQGDMAGGKFQWVVGSFFSWVRPVGINGQGSFNFATPGGAVYDVKTDSKAVYAQGTVDLGLLTPGLDGLRFTAGVRNTWDKYEGSRFSASYFNIPFAEASDKNSQLTWTFGLDYQATDRVLLYGKVTRGYKTGGFNFVGVSPTGLTYRPEVVTSYEIGAKTDFRLADMPGRFNIAAYRLDYEDIQRATGDNQFNGCQNASCLDQGAVTFNAGSAKVQGIEVEAYIRPVRGLQLSANYAYTDAKYKKFNLPVAPDPFFRTKLTCNGPLAVPFPGPGAQPVTADMSCIPFPFTPKHQFNVNGRYEHELGDAGTLVAVANYSWVAHQFQSPIALPEAEPGSRLDSYGLLNLSLEWNAILGSSFDARAFVTNATDKVYRISNGNQTEGAVGTSASIYGEPRMYGFSLRYRFGDDK